MPPRKVYKYRELLKALRKYDKRFQEHKERGKGSHRFIYHPDVNGREESYPVPCHNEGDDVNPAYVKVIARRFNLPEDLL